MSKKGKAGGVSGKGEQEGSVAARKKAWVAVKELRPEYPTINVGPASKQTDQSGHRSAMCQLRELTVQHLTLYVC